MKTLKQRNRLMKRKGNGKLVALTKNCEGMLLRPDSDPAYDWMVADKWLFTVQDGNVYIHFQDLTWSVGVHNHWFNPYDEIFIIVDTNFKF